MKSELFKAKKDYDQFLLWLDFLRAGVFRKGKGVLNPTKNTYCCLGVGCVLFIPESNLKFNAAECIFGDTPDYQDEAPQWLMDLPDHCRDNFGFDIEEHNDRFDWSHARIADRLEQLYTKC